jgi:endonuclease/exonuclease/phosphatase (EEP) superfamily protein YafD
MVIGALAAGCAWRAVRPPVPAALLLPCTRPDCVRVVTWNLHAIPFVTTNPMARVGNVALKIREQQPDVVLLQELWTYAYPRRLARLLQGEYRLTSAVGCGRPFPCGGLAVLVRIASGWRASDPTFVPFDAVAPWYRLTEGDAIAKKGALLLHLTRGDAALGVLDTHLQTGYIRYGRDYSDVQRQQLAQLSRILPEHFGAGPVILGGDFNIARGDVSGLYATAVAALGDDRTWELGAACGGCGTHRSLIRPGRGLDYVLTRNLTATATATLIPNETADQPFSDHDGLLVRLE